MQLHKRPLMCATVPLALLCAATLLGEEDPEAALRAEFAKAYQTPDAKERLKALSKLTRARQPATLNLLYGIAARDGDAGVRAEALNQLAASPDTDGTVATAVVRLFETDRDVSDKAAIAGVFHRLTLQHHAVQALVTYLQRAPLPDPPRAPDDRSRQGQPLDRNSPQWQAYERAQAQVQKTRAEYQQLLTLFNSLAKQKIKLSSKDTRQQVRQWWSEHSAELLRADQERAAKLRGVAEVKPRDDGVKKPAAERPKPEPQKEPDAGKKPAPPVPAPEEKKKSALEQVLDEEKKGAPEKKPEPQPKKTAEKPQDE